jgi:uncharacterized protein RhaS with RHS repeats
VGRHAPPPGDVSRPVRCGSHAAPAANDANADAGVVRDAVYYFHNDVSGMPEELTDADGDLVWQARYKVWGNAVQEEWIQREAPRPQNLRFQGQYLDREAGPFLNVLVVLGFMPRRILAS